LWSLCLEKPPMVGTNSYKFMDSSPECFELVSISSNLDGSNSSN
jgi:hypothetical protein